MIRWMLTLLLLGLSGPTLAEEIPAAKIAKVTHQEGYRVMTPSYQTGEALVWLKGAEKPTLMLVLQQGKGPVRCFTLTRPSKGVTAAEGKDIKIVLDNVKKVLRVTSGGRTVEEKFSQEIDS